MPADLRLVHDDDRAHQLIEQFQGLALRHLLLLSRLHRPCAEPERTLCGLCQHARRANFIATIKVPRAGVPS